MSCCKSVLNWEVLPLIYWLQTVIGPRKNQLLGSRDQQDSNVWIFPAPLCEWFVCKQQCRIRQWSFTRITWSHNPDVSWHYFMTTTSFASFLHSLLKTRMTYEKAPFSIRHVLHFDAMLLSIQNQGVLVLSSLTWHRTSCYFLNL